MTRLLFYKSYASHLSQYLPKQQPSTNNYLICLINTHYLFAGPRCFPNKKKGGHGDTVEKGLGPRPLGPIGPMVQVDYFPPRTQISFRLNKSKTNPVLKKCQKITPTLLHCAHSQTNSHFELFHIPDPENVFLGLGTFWHVQ